MDINGYSINDTLANGGEINGDLGIVGDVDITGNLNVSDTITADTIVSNVDLEVTDPLILCGKDNPNDLTNLGLIEELTDGIKKWSGLIRSKNDKKQYLLEKSVTKPSNSTDITILPRGTLVSSAVETSTIIADDIDSVNAVAIGFTTAPDVFLSRTGRDTTVQGGLVVDQASILKGAVTFNNGVNSYTYPVTRGDNLDFLQTDASGNVSWVSGAETIKSLSTGVISGGTLSVNGGDDTKFDISDGEGEIIDADTGTKTKISWTGLTAQSTTYSGILTFVSINSSGLPIYSTSKPTNEGIRNDIFLGVLVHVNSVNIDVVNNEQMTILNTSNQLHDLANAIGFINTIGNIVGPKTLLKFEKNAGNVFAFGANFYINHKDPHIVSTPLVDTTAGGIFQYRYQDGSSSALTLTDIIPTEYDDGNGQGSPGAVATNKWQVQRVYLFTSNNVKIQPGQAVYNSYGDALNGISSEAFNTEPSIADNGLLIAFIIIRGGATDLNVTNDAVFIQAGKFGGSGSGGGGGTSTHSLQNAYDGGSDITLNNTENGIVVKDASTPVASDLLKVTDNAGTTDFFAVYADKVVVNKPLTVGDYIIPDAVGFANTSLRVNGAATELEFVDRRTVTGGTPDNFDSKSFGYSIGSLWLDTTTDNMHLCIDDAIGSAFWKILTYNGIGNGDFATDSITLNGNITCNNDTRVYIKDNSAFSYRLEVDGGAGFVRHDSTTGASSTLFSAGTVTVGNDFTVQKDTILSQDVTLSDQSYIRHGTSSATTPRGTIFKFVANETISAGYLLKIVDASGSPRVEVIKFGDSDGTPVIGVSYTSATIGTDIDVITSGIFEVVVQDTATVNIGNLIEKSDVSGQDGRCIPAAASDGSFAVALSSGTGNPGGTVKIKAILKHSESF